MCRAAFRAEDFPTKSSNETCLNRPKPAKFDCKICRAFGKLVVVICTGAFALANSYAPVMSPAHEIFLVRQLLHLARISRPRRQSGAEIVTVPFAAVGVNNTGASLDALTFVSASGVVPTGAFAAIVNVTVINI